MRAAQKRQDPNTRKSDAERCLLDCLALLTGGIAGGRWTLQVSDNLRRDVGALNSWSLDLRSS